MSHLGRHVWQTLRMHLQLLALTLYLVAIGPKRHRAHVEKLKLRCRMGLPSKYSLCVVQKNL